MATISELLTTIQTAIYGKDLRTALAEAIKILNEELTNISETTGNDTSSNTTPYTLPIASADTLGGIKIGKDLSVSKDGTLNIHPELTDEDIGKFLHVNLNKEIDKVQLTGEMFTLGDKGLELSLSGRIELMLLVYNELLRTKEISDIPLDDLATNQNIYSGFTEINENKNSELYDLYEGNINVAFISTRNFGYEVSDNSISLSVQIAYPFSIDAKYSPAIRYGGYSTDGGTEWGEWSTLSGTLGTDTEPGEPGTEPGAGSTAETVDISSDFGTWDKELPDDIGSIQVVRTGNIINGSITMIGTFNETSFNLLNFKEIFKINEKYRPVFDTYCASTNAYDITNRSIITSAGQITGEGNVKFSMNGQSADYGYISVIISFTYACES